MGLGGAAAAPSDKVDVRRSPTPNPRKGGGRLCVNARGLRLDHGYGYALTEAPWRPWGLVAHPLRQNGSIWSVFESLPTQELGNFSLRFAHVRCRGHTGRDWYLPLTAGNSQNQTFSKG